MLRIIARWRQARRLKELESQKAIAWQTWCDAKHRGDTRAQHERYRVFRAVTHDCLRAELALRGKA